MCKKFLRKSQMTKFLVDEAAGWAEVLIKSEARGPCDFGPAMMRIAGRVGVSFSKLWALRYRRPKTIAAEVYFSLREAYEAERARQLRMLSDDARITTSAAGADAHSVRAAMDVLDEDSCVRCEAKE